MTKGWGFWAGADALAVLAAGLSALTVTLAVEAFWASEAETLEGDAGAVEAADLRKAVTGGTAA